MLQKIAANLPPTILRRIGRLQYEFFLLAPLVHWISQRFMQCSGVIKYGVGRGLKFNAKGGAAGYLLGTLEPREQDLLSQILTEGSVFYDIGANVGFFSTLAARIVGETAKVYAFEPFPEFAKLARLNAELNDFHHVEVIEAAASSQTGQMHLSMARSESVSFKLATGEGPNNMAVQAISIDDFSVSYGASRPNLVMIDVEGQEINVLKGMLQVLRDCKPTIMCEVHWLGESFVEFCTSVLQPMGYGFQAFEGQPLPCHKIRYHAIISPESKSI